MGRVIAVCTAVFSVVLFAMPVGLIAAGFEDAMNHLQENEKEEGNEVERESPHEHHISLPPLLQTQLWRVLSLVFISTPAAAAVAGQGDLPSGLVQLDYVSRARAGSQV